MTLSTPVQAAERIQIIDAIRGFALCGILILNIYYFGRPEPAIFNLDVYHEIGNANIITWYITQFIVEGSFRALFSMLFGAGCILLVTRLEKKEGGLKPADVYFTRLTWLLIFGMINAFVFLWPGDILYSYAICGLMILPFRKSKIRTLLLLSLFFISCTIFFRWNQDSSRMEMIQKGAYAISLQEQKKTLTEEQKSDAEKLKEFTDETKPEGLKKKADKELIDMNKSYAAVFKHLLPINKEIESTIFYKNIFFDVMVFLFLGMALFKMGVLTGEVATWIYVVFFFVGYTFGIGTGILEGNAWYDAKFQFLEYIKTKPFPFDLYQLHRVATAFGHIGALMLMWKSGVFGWFLKPFMKVGQMAFTNYLMQSLICTFYFYGYGFGNFGKLERYELWYVVVSVWVFQIIFSMIWLRFYLYGPFEWLWRSLTYKEIQPLKRNASLTPHTL